MGAFANTLFRDLAFCIENPAYNTISDFLRRVTDESLDIYTKPVAEIVNGGSVREQCMVDAILFATMIISQIENKGNNKVRLDEEGKWLSTLDTILKIEKFKRMGLIESYRAVLSKSELEFVPTELMKDYAKRFPKEDLDKFR